MKDLLISGTTETPCVSFSNDGMLKIFGTSIPEDAVFFYEELVDWLEEYAKNPNKKTTLTFSLYYFNTPSTILIKRVMDVVSNMRSKKHSVDIIWEHERDDEDMREVGEEYKIITKGILVLKVVDDIKRRC